MLRNDYDGQTCSIARTLEVVGERWTLLVVRDLFLGLRRFDEIQANLGIARNVLTTRLEKLVEAGVVEKRPYSERPLRHEYRLTDRGRDLWPALHGLMAWGDEHLPEPGGPPTEVVHRGDCGGRLDARGVCTRCGVLVPFAETLAVPGPGSSPRHPLLVAAERRAQAGS